MPAFATAAGTALVFQKISWSMRQFTPDQVRNSAVGTMAVWLVFLIVQLILREILKKKISKMISDTSLISQFMNSNYKSKQYLSHEVRYNKTNHMYYIYVQMRVKNKDERERRNI